MVKAKIDMKGWKMWEHGVPDSKLTVIKQVEDYVTPKGIHIAQWLCECSCPEHNLIIVSGNNLKSGNTKSCGCIAEEINNKKYNNYEKRIDETGEYYVGITSNTGSEFYFDVEDYEIVSQYYWNERVDNHGYHHLQAWDGNAKKHIKLHWLIIGKHVDHKDRNPLNNRRDNLRKATFRENSRNQSKSTKNTSGVVGVGWYPRYNKWRAYITTDKNKNITLGYFNNKDDAIRTRLIAEQKYFGEFAPQQHLYEQYGITVQND